MRVLMFGWEFPPFQAGGLATATRGLVKGLLASGVGVTLVVPFAADRSPLPALRLVSGRAFGGWLRRVEVPSVLVPYQTEEAFARVLEGLPPDAAVPYGKNLREEVERLANVAGEIAASEPHDVIDSHDWLTFAAGLRARDVSGKPLVAHIHATEFDRAGEHGDPDVIARERDGLARADRVISNSRALKRLVNDRYGVPDERIEVVHWGIDPEIDARTAARGPGPFPTGDPVVLFLGRVTRQKGPEYFLEVAARVRPLVPRARFVVAGVGDLLPALVERAAELGILDRVHFAGPLDRAGVDRAFRLATVCLMPSVSEPFGLVALEGALRGTPVLVPRTAGVSEVLANALRIDFWDIEEMTEKVVSVLRHASLRAELVERGVEEVSGPRFSLEEPARRTRDVYLSAIAARGRGPH